MNGKILHLSSDPEIFETVSGVKIDFVSQTASLSSPAPTQPQLNKKEIIVIDAEIENLQQKGVISTATPLKDQFISPVFVRPKKDGSHRMILNLKRLNEVIAYHHFKMDTLETALG